jgi:hypothetical protein
MGKKVIRVQDSDITLITKDDEDYISLTDMAKNFDGEASDYIKNWMRTGSTVQYLGAWERIHNPEFDLAAFEKIKSKVIENTFIMSAKKWIGETNAIGLAAKAGRYGGTYAHNEIALQFATWLSPDFHVYLVKEFKRLKTQEAEDMKETLDWNVKRVLSKLNYRLQTQAIKDNLIPERIRQDTKKQGFIYASEADVLNVALFGMTAKEWRIINPTKKGNIRDHATGEQLLVMANLESHNAAMIREGLRQDERVEKLNEIAIYQMQILISTSLSGEIKKQLDTEKKKNDNEEDEAGNTKK